MHFETGSRATAVRYVSVRAGLGGGAAYGRHGRRGQERRADRSAQRLIADLPLQASQQDMAEPLPTRRPAGQDCWDRTLVNSPWPFFVLCRSRGRRLRTGGPAVESFGSGLGCTAGGAPACRLRVCRWGWAGQTMGAFWAQAVEG